MNASVAIQVLPQQVEQKKMLECVDAVIEYIASCNVKYTVGPFETVLEGDFDVLMEIVRACFRICVAAGALLYTAGKVKVAGGSTKPFWKERMARRIQLPSRLARMQRGL